MDPLSDVLSLLRPRRAVSAGLKAGGAWALQFPGHDGIKFNAVLQGACWVSVDGEAEPHPLRAGDCFLLTRGKPFRLATDRGLLPIPSEAIYDRAVDGIATCNGGGDFFLIGGRFHFDSDQAGLLFDALPAIVHVQDASNQASVLRWSLEQLAGELNRQPLGGALMADHLAQIMLLQVLRLWLASDQARHAGWLRALADPRLARALEALHAEPQRRWRLDALAARAGLSRTVFAERFHETVGLTPFEYLRRWRLHLAADRLRRTQASVAAIAHGVGYESEAAFSTAFRRVFGQSPLHYRMSGSNRATMRSE
ncbi:AraC family transcriptional regulator [Methylobacterium phyllostachyos]|uniref:AraC family transcriptional regulator n=1 Tax=Methylobacterium phyllostachyos TaxID=582672 RepID=UPI003CC7AA5C